ncbi:MULTISPECIES: DoxX family protein [Cupriavidus]|uniref:DoxX family protein n=1 Tax=Cupriavidus TaxID=106589 RepID=UPI0007E474DE|nr:MULTISPECIES: DoxX family protein [Cupriavidus]MCD9121208.1 DoxX family protein [Cupriavidus sp. UGS-1]MCT9071837.1 DoxX family protein [Cupriavidus gilardii]QKS63686.1 DoxX family protein [Cupriavidus gilardii]
MAATHGSQDLGKAVLRIVLGILILLHGIAKVINGPGHIVQMVDQAGLPSFLAYGVYIGEVLAPVLLIIGLWTRAAALVIVINMLFAVGLVHMHQLGMLNKSGGWELELQGMFLGAAVAVMLLGAGRFSVGGAGGPLN